MLDFRTAAERAAHLWIDRAFLFGNARHPSSRLGCTPFLSCLGLPQVSGGLSPLHTNYYIIYLGAETTPGSFGEGPATLTPGGGDPNPLAVHATGK